MISSLRGKLIFKKNAEAILDVNGVGYHLLLSKKASDKLHETEKEYSVITYLDVKENSLQLYGFFDEKEKEIFKLLLTVSGIGPKNAHTILQYAGFEDLINIITKNFSSSSIKIPGVGSKKLELISMTLKDKIFKIDKEISYEDFSPNSLSAPERVRSEALSALMNLGYARAEAEKLIREVLKENENSFDFTTEEIIRKSLEIITRA